MTMAKKKSKKKPAGAYKDSSTQRQVPPTTPAPSVPLQPAPPKPKKMPRAGISASPRQSTARTQPKPAPAKSPFGSVPKIPNVIPTPLANLARTTGGPFDSSGSDAVYAYGGRLVSYEHSPDLIGRNLFTTYDNAIATCVIIGAAVRYFQNLVGGAGWDITAKEDTGDDSMAQRAEMIVKQGLVEANMDHPWSLIARRAAMFKFYGFSIHEWTVRRRPQDGLIVFKDISHRPQLTVDMWDIPDEGGPFRGVIQLVPMRPEYFYVPRERMFYCVDNSITDQPNGVGLLRHVVEHSRRLKRLEQLEGFGYEGDLRGMPIGRVPGAELKKLEDRQKKQPGWVDDQTSAVKQLVQNHLKSPFMGIVLDSATYQTEGANASVSAIPKWGFDIIKSQSSGLAEISACIERINREIARVLGMEFLLLGSQTTGSLALSRDKTSMFAAVMESVMHELAWFTLHDLVYPLLELNGIDPEQFAPQINPDPIATERIEAVIASLVGMAQAGAPLAPDDPAIDQVRSRLHLANQPKLTPEVSGALQRGPRQQGGQQRPEAQQAQNNPAQAGNSEPGKGNISAVNRTSVQLMQASSGPSRVERQLEGQSGYGKELDSTETRQLRDRVRGRVLFRQVDEE